MDGPLLRKRRYMTVDSAVEVAGFGRVQMFYLLAACVVFFTEVQIIVTVGLTLPSVTCEWNLPKRHVLAMLMVSTGSFILGGLLGGVLSDKYGRRRVVLAGIACMVMCGVLALLQHNFLLFMVFRAGCLFSFTFVKASSLCLVLEITPRSYRFLVKMVLAVAGQLGATAATLAATQLMNSVGWRLLLLWVVLPCLLPLLIYCALDESPRFLLVSGDTAGGIALLKKLLLRNGREDVSGLVRHKKGVNRGQIGQIFTPEFEKTSLLVLAVFLLKNLISSTIHISIPFIIQGPYCEASNGTHHDNRGQECAGLSDDDLYSLSKAYLLGIGITIGGLSLAQLVGRKPAAITFYIATSGALISNLWCHGKEALIMKISVALALNHGSVAIVSLFIQEVYPTSVRALATGFMFSCGYAITLLSPYITVYGITGNEFEFFSVGGMVFLICAILFGQIQHETKNEPLQENARFSADTDVESDWSLDYDD